MSLADARSEGLMWRSFIRPSMPTTMQAHLDEDVVFLSVGFETTTPPSCLAVKQAVADGMTNFSLLTANKTMPMAYEAMKDSADAFLYPGHVDAVMGTGDGEAMLKEGVSGVVAGFTAKELLTAFAVILAKFPQGKPFFKNCYPRVVKAEGARQHRPHERSHGTVRFGMARLRRHPPVGAAAAARFRCL